VEAEKSGSSDGCGIKVPLPTRGGVLERWRQFEQGSRRPLWSQYREAASFMPDWFSHHTVLPSWLGRTSDMHSEFDPRPPHYRLVGIDGTGDRLRAGIPLRHVTSHLGQLSLLPSVGRETNTGQSSVMHSAAGSRLKAGWLTPFVDKLLCSVAVITVHDPFNT